jgi:hypothetical protein
MLTPVADTYVRDGAYASSNYGHADGNLDEFHAREAGSNPPQLVLTVRP